MAIYIPASRRRRRLILVAVAALVGGLLLGLLFGQLRTPSLDDAVASRRRDAAQLIARLDGLNLEYQQAGGTGASAADAREGALEAARGISADTVTLLADLPWLAEEQRREAATAVDGVGQAVDDGGSADEVAEAVASAEAALRSVAGLPPASG